MLAEERYQEIGLSTTTHANDDDTHLTQRHLAQRLLRIESTVELIQNSLLEAAETGETRHEHLLQHLQELKDDVVRNHKLLNELKQRGCFSCGRECMFVGVLFLVAMWLYFVHNYFT